MNRYEMDLALSNAAKDAKIGQLEADKYTDEKITAVYANLEGQINGLRDRFDAKTHDNEQAINNLGTQVATLAANKLHAHLMKKANDPATAADGRKFYVWGHQENGRNQDDSGGHQALLTTR